MEIVASSLVMRKFRTIKDFQMDLGLSKTSEVQKEGNKGSAQIVIKIKDPFIKRYNMEKGVYLSKTGYIGTLLFYIDASMRNDEFIIYDQNKEYPFTYKDNQNVREYLSSVLDKILSNEIQPVELGINYDEKMEFSIDKNLPQTEFIEEYLKMQQKMANMDIKTKK
jgi:hypothetical protein